MKKALSLLVGILVLMIPLWSLGQSTFSTELAVENALTAKVLKSNAGELVEIRDNIYPQYYNWVSYVYAREEDSPTQTIPAKNSYQRYMEDDVEGIRFDFELATSDDKVHLSIPAYTFSFKHNEDKAQSESVVISNPQCLRPFDEDSEDVAYVFRLTLDVKQSQLQASLPSFDDLINQFKKGALDNAFEVRYAGEESEKKLTPQDQVEYSTTSYVDTLITYNPDTYEETIKTSNWMLEDAEVSEYRLLISLYFDKRCAAWVGRLDGYQPLSIERDEDGEMKWNRALFTIKN